MSGGIRLEGFIELGRDLDAVEPKIREKGVRAGLRKAANRIKKEAMRRVPARTGPGGGRLKRAIRVGKFRGEDLYTVGSSVFVNAGRKRSDLKGAYYGKMVEYGHNLTRGRANKGGKVLRRVKSQPFMRPAFDTSQAAISREIERDINAALNRELKKGAR